MAGTRTPRRSKRKLNGSGPMMPSGLGTLTGGGTWSKKPPCSS